MDKTAVAALPVCAAQISLRLVANVLIATNVGQEMQPMCFPLPERPEIEETYWKLNSSSPGCARSEKPATRSRNMFT